MSGQPRPEPSAADVAVVVLAAGEGRRAGHETNKVLLPLAGRPIFLHSLRTAAALPEVGRVVLVVRRQDLETVESAVHDELPGTRVEVVIGGATRHESEWHALQRLRPFVKSGDTEVVVLHDAARPLAPVGLFRAVVAEARRHGGALPGCLEPALVALADGGEEPATVIAVQTPQAFRAAPLLAAYARAAEDGFVGTDTASCVERYTDIAVRWVPGHPANLKVTFPEDLALAECLHGQSAGPPVTARRAGA
jgi:2-C-methyl-D-erythritol 4-phosphate cytidylyltransferase